jgi:hypothetical protein
MSTRSPTIRPAHTGPTRTDTDQPTPPSDGVKWPDLVQGATSLAILFGLGLYGAVRFGHQVFCDQLGVRPEDIGLTYAASISRAAVILVVLAICVGMLLAAVALLDNIQVKLPKPIQFLNPLAAALTGWIAGAIPTSILLVLAGLMGATSPRTTLVITVGLLLVMVIFFFVQRWRRRDTPNQAAQPALEERPPPDRLSLLRNWPRVVLLACLLTAAAFITSGVSANMAVNHVKNGEALQRGGLGFLGLRGEPVLVTGDLADDLYLSNRLIMYLGQSDGSVVLYDVGANWPMRLPTDGISIVSGVHLVTGEFVLKEGRAIDLDDVAAALEANKPIDLNAASTERDTRMFELGIRNGAIQPPTMLDPRSAVRIAKVNSGAAPRRATCATATESLEKPLPVADLREGVQLCVRTDLDRWIMLRVRQVKQSPAELKLQMSDWPG